MQQEPAGGIQPKAKNPHSQGDRGQTRQQRELTGPNAAKAHHSHGDQREHDAHQGLLAHLVQLFSVPHR